MIEDTLIQQLKSFIKERYELVGGPRPRPLPGTNIRTPLEKLSRGMGPGPIRLENVIDVLSGFIKKERNTETFSAMLERLRLEKGMTAAKLYNGAWVQKQLYSKIMGERNYHPSKNTVIAFGFSLRLNREDMGELLESAGFLLSNSSIFDLVIIFCLENRLYDLHDVNALLLSTDQKVLCRE